MTDLPDIADIRMKLAVMHYGLEFYHHLRGLGGVDRQSYPFDFLIELIDDLERVETESRPGIMVQVKLAPRTARESLEGLNMFCNRMNYYLKADTARKLEVNRFYAKEAAVLRGQSNS